MVEKLFKKIQQSLSNSLLGRYVTSRRLLDSNARVEETKESLRDRKRCSAGMKKKRQLLKISF